MPREERVHHHQVLPRRVKRPGGRGRGSLRRLGVDHVDLYIVHWPQGGPTWAWPGMEQARERGYARSIGVSNYGVDELDQVLRSAEHAVRS